jgi:hypothetical protein
MRSDKHGDVKLRQPRNQRLAKAGEPVTLKMMPAKR